MAFVQFAKDFVIERLDGASDKQAAGVREFRKRVGVAEEVLDLYGDVIGEVRKLPVQLAHDVLGMRNAIEKIRVAKSNVLSPCRNLLPDIADHNFSRNDAKLAGINRDDGTVPAKMFASA